MNNIHLQYNLCIDTTINIYELVRKLLLLCFKTIEIFYDTIKLYILDKEQKLF